MKEKWLTLLAAVVGSTIILLTGYQPVVAAPPTGEVKTVAAMFGHQIPVPYLEAALANDYMQLLYDHLVGCNPETGRFSFDHGLANKWEMSPDGLDWTFFLRKGVRFHDNVELTAKDVKFSIELFLLPDALSDTAPFLRRQVKSIEVKDPYTLVIHCNRPVFDMLNQFTNSEATGGMVIPKDYFERVGKEEFTKHPIGSGPYKWHSQQVGSFIKLEATQSHWRDGVPRFKYMSYLVIPEESTQMAMLRAGEADIARISRNSVKDALDWGLNVIPKENGGVLAFNPNMQWASPAFSDIRFRKALNLAIDKEAIIRHLFAGMGKSIAMYPGSNVVAIGGDVTLKPYSHDPQEARRLLKESGWEGYEFTLLSYARAGCPEFEKVVEALAGYWEKIGLKPKIRATEFTVAHRARYERKSQNVVHGANDSTNPDVAALLIKFQERWYFDSKFALVNIPELNEKFKRIEKSIDKTEISKLLADIYRYAYDQYLLVPICEFPEMIATTKRIPKWNPGVRRQDRNYNDLIRQR